MSRTRRGCTASPPRPRFEDRLALWDVAAGPNQPLRCPVPWAGSAELGHLVTPEELRTLVTDAELEVIARNDLTGPFARLMHTVLNATGSLPDRVLYGRRTVSVVARTLPDRHDPCLSVRPGTKTVRPRARRPGARSPLWL